MRHKNLILTMFFVLALAVVFSFLTSSAESRTATWDGGGGDALASTAGNWDGPNVAPLAGDTIVFNAGAADCTWDLALSFAGYYINASYTGVITQTATYSCTVWVIASGTYTGPGGDAVFVKCSGSVTATGGTLTSDKMNLNMTGSGIMTLGNKNLHWFVVYGTATIPAGIGYDQVSRGMIVYGTLINNCDGYGNKGILLAVDKVPYTLANYGTISGSGYLCYYVSSGTCSVTVPGILASCNVVAFRESGGAAGNSLVTLSSSVSSSTFLISSDHATSTMAFDLNSKSLSATTITVSTRGVIGSSVAGSKITTTGAITVSANGVLNATNIPYISCGGGFDPSAGMWVPDDGQVNLTSSYKLIKLGAGQTMYNLQLVNYINVTGSTQIDNLLRWSGLVPGKNHTWAYGTTVLTDGKLSNASGQVDLGDQTLAVHNLYYMDQYPEITTTPVTVDSMAGVYSYDADASEAVTWSITCSSPDIDIDANGVVSGYLSNDTAITVIITATDALGAVAIQSYTITVHGPMTDLAPMMVGIIPVIALIVIISVGMGSIKRKKG